jgi:phosphotransferase system HPr (HPr) family protein
MPDPTESPAAFVGIDWADCKHDIYVYPADGSAATHEVIEAKSEAIQDWILKMREQFAREGRKVLVGLEQSKGALIYQLMEHDFFVLYPINPKTLASFQEAFRPSGAKGDVSDAEYIWSEARFARTMRPFHSNVRVGYNGTEVDGKSVMDLMTLAPPEGTKVRIRIEGPDAAEAMRTVEHLMQSRSDDD